MRRSISIITMLLLALMPTAIADPNPVEITIVSVKASHQGAPQKTFGRGLESVQRAIASLDYDTFEKLGSSNATIPFDEKTTFFINKTYSLVVEPTAIDDSGRIRMKTQVMMKKKEKDPPVKALDTMLVMAPGKQLNLGGLKVGNSDLIVVLSVR